MLTTLLEAAFRSALMAGTVWAGIRMLRVHHVMAQKLAWVLVLLAAGLMPMVMRAPFLALNRAIRIPLRDVASFPPLEHLAQGLMMSQPLGVQVAGGILMNDSLPVRPVAHELLSLAKPRAAHRDWFAERVPQNRPGWHYRSQSWAEVHAASAGSPTQRIVTGLNANETAGLATLSKARSERAAVVTRSRIQLLLSLAYFAVLTVLLFRTFAAAAVAFRIWKRSVPISRGFCDSDSIEMSTTKFRVRVSADLASPVTIGSTILLPANFCEWDAAKLRVVLAHEQSHVRQRDFYLQFAAATHADIFWFSPLGWWLKRKLSELGETLSDRAGLEKAASPASYAQILLEFAAIPHKPYAGVAMARTSNLSSRIDRILSERHTRLAFPTGRRSAVLTALLVPAALIAVVACIRIVPSVEAAQTQNATSAATPGSSPATSSSTPSTTESAPQSSSVMNQSADTNAGSVTVEKQGSESASGQVTSTGEAEQNDSVVAPIPPTPPVPGVEAPEAPEPLDAEDASSEDGPRTHSHSHGFAYAMNEDGDGSFAILNGKDSDVTIYGKSSKALEEAKRKYHNNFIWFERDGKSYVITDPAIVAQSEAMFKNDPRLEARKRVLQSRMDNFDQEMKRLEPEIEKASKPGPEFEAQMAQLNKQLAELQSDKFKHLTEDINKAVATQSKDMDATIQKLTQEKMESLGDLQEKIGEIQGQLGEIQGKIGERQGLMGEKQSEIGERMGKVGEMMGQIGEEEGHHAEEASRKMQSVLDQAIKNGKAKPVD